jgi:hypothetical protein
VLPQGAVAADPAPAVRDPLFTALALQTLQRMLAAPVGFLHLRALDPERQAVVRVELPLLGPSDVLAREGAGAIGGVRIERSVQRLLGHFESDAPADDGVR